MAQLKDTIVSGNLRVTDTTLTDTLQVTTIKAPTSSGGTTYGPGTSGQVLKSNGTMTYWADMPTIPTVNNASLTLKGAGTTITTFTANSSTNQSLDIVAGSNVTITPDATNHKITIASSYTNTDTKVKVTANTTTQGYLIASTTSPNGTAVEGIADTGVYLGTTAGSLYATSFYENGTSLASKYAAIGHTHGLLHADLNQASTNGTTGGWSVIGIDPAVTGYVLKSIRVNTTSPEWLSGDYGAGIAFGGSDTKGVISMKYQSPVITFAGGSHNSSRTEPIWYLKISGTSGSTYNLANFYDSTISRTANTVLAAPNGSNGEATFRKLVAADIPYLNYSGVASSWWNDRDNAVIRLTKADSYYRPLWSLLTSTTGSWAVGNHDNDDLVFNFTSKAIYDTGANPASNAYKQVKFTNAGGITTTGAITATGTGTFRTGDFGTQLIVERTGGANMAGITFKNTSGVLGYIAANTVDGDLYHYGATDTSTMKYVILDSHNYTSYPLPRNIKHIHTANGTDGSGGWVKIARITVTAAYADQPMTFTIAQRRIMQYRIHLLFTNSGSVAATAISEFIITRDNSWTDTNNDPRAYIIKPSDGIFDLYIRKTVSWDRIFVVDFTKADDGGGINYSITWENVHTADSAITGGTEAVKKLYLPTTTNYAGSSSVGGAATSANKLNSNAGATNRPVYFSDGVPVQCDTPASGSFFKGVPLITTDGVMEIGKYIDFHKSNGSTADYDLRLQYTGTATGKTITLPGATGTVALLTKGSTSFWGLMDGDGSTSNWIRATSHGFIPSAEARFFQTATSSLGTDTWYFKHSYIQNMTANRLVLGVAKTTDGAAKGQVKFFSGNANDTTGTVTLECINDSARTGDYTVKLPTWNGTIPIFEKLFDGALRSVSLSYSDIDEYDLFLITVANSNATTEQVTVASLWISNIAGVHDMPLIWGGAPTSSGGSCNVTSGWIQLSKSSGTTTFNIGHKSNVAQMTSSGWSISSPTYNLYIRKIFGLKTYKRT